LFEKTSLLGKLHKTKPTTRGRLNMDWNNDTGQFWKTEKIKRKQKISLE